MITNKEIEYTKIQIETTIKELENKFNLVLHHRRNQYPKLIDFVSKILGPTHVDVLKLKRLIEQLDQEEQQLIT